MDIGNEFCSRKADASHPARDRAKRGSPTESLERVVGFEPLNVNV
ncbi:MAG TPA: hypothetical protein VFE91_04300 [Nitrososphaerales archaeon]|nr:hypothetical protein [Nitrososphaerales archaeon]